MGAPAAQFQFAAEMVAFLVCLAGATLLALRAPLLTVRRGPAGALALGFAAGAAGAFVHGAVQAADAAPPAVVGLRVAAGVLLLIGALARKGWTGGPVARALLMPAGLLVGAAGPIGLQGSLYAEEAVLVAGAALAGTALVGASRRAIGARLTATAAGTLLLVVVTLSVALSTVLSGTVRDDAFRRLQSRAASVATAVTDSWQADLADAKLVAAGVQGLGLVGPGGSGPALQSALTTLSTQFFSTVGLAWVDDQGRVLATSPRLEATIGAGVAPAVAGSNLVARSVQTGQPGGTVGLAAGRALDVAAYPAKVAGSNAVGGVAVVLSPLDRSYLSALVRDDSTLGVALVAGGKVVSAYPASARAQPADALAAASHAAGGRAPAPLATGDRYAAAAVVLGGDGRPVMAALVETSAQVVDSSRQSLFRTLFLIAFGGAIIAFLLSVAVADRLSRALGELTGAARRISSGEAMVRTDLTAGDEIGLLSEAFDSMAESIEEQAAALRLAAQEEANLRDRMQSVIAGMGEALVAVDADGTVSEWNRAAERLVGVPRSRAVGRPARSVLKARLDDGSDLAGLLTKGGAPRPGEDRATLDTRGGPIPVAVSIGVVAGADDEPGEGNGAGIVTVLRDLRPEMELDKMKSEFLSRVGHELRTPLTGILGYSQLLANRDVPEDRARVWYQEILEQSRRLLRTVEMLEFFASAGGNRLGLDLAPVNVASLVVDAAERWQAKVTQFHEVVAHEDGGIPDADMDRRWIDLALDELLDNAVKFSPDGGRVVVSAEAAGTGALRLTVEDQGWGMPPEQAGDAFREFVQGDPSDTRQFGGLGLGLPLVQRVAEAHGGSVELASEEGRGTRVSVILPTGRSARSGRRPARA
ncbi:MAG TPA: ATP-binding protein [Acidimicrobiales bacterium]|nr:ATP-binding protein [Acidimicrobiales bacterium]